MAKKKIGNAVPSIDPIRVTVLAEHRLVTNHRTDRQTHDNSVAYRASMALCFKNISTCVIHCTHALVIMKCKGGNLGGDSGGPSPPTFRVGSYLYPPPTNPEVSGDVVVTRVAVDIKYHIHIHIHIHSCFVDIHGYIHINDKNCSLSIVLTAMDQKQQKS